MYRVYVIIALFWFIFGCSSSEKGRISLFNQLEYELEKGEEVGNIDELVQEEYQNLMKDSSRQIPLFRFVRSKDYRLFIGIPYGTSFDELKQLKLKEARLLDEDSSDKYAFKKYKKGNYAISECVYKSGNNLFIVFGITLFEKNIAFLSKENIINRLKRVGNEK